MENSHVIIVNEMRHVEETGMREEGSGNERANLAEAILCR